MVLLFSTKLRPLHHNILRSSSSKAQFFFFQHHQQQQQPLRSIANRLYPMASQQNSDIHLYTAQTPNGIKVSILLEELGVPYKVTAIDISKDVQKEPWFLEINPNGRIPALTDVLEDGTPISLFESGAIMQYLVERYDSKEHKVSYPQGSKEYYQTQSWLFWQMGGLGPMQGQANHFTRYAPEKIQYGINRYQNETRRLYRVMDKQLEKNGTGYLVGNKATIADFSCWGWVAAHGWCGIKDFETQFPNLNKWLNKLLERPGLEKGRHVPSKHTNMEKNKLSEEELDKMAEASRAWVQKGMAEDAKK